MIKIKMKQKFSDGVERKPSDTAIQSIISRIKSFLGREDLQGDVRQNGKMIEIVSLAKPHMGRKNYLTKNQRSRVASRLSKQVFTFTPDIMPEVEVR